jgi:hypothetical protein
MVLVSNRVRFNYEQQLEVVVQVFGAGLQPQELPPAMVFRVLRSSFVMVFSLE